MFTTLEDLDFAVDIELLCSKKDNMQEKKSQFGLELNAKRLKKCDLAQHQT